MKRAGKKFSQESKDKINKHLDMLDEHCKSVRGSINEIKKSADELSSMLDDAESAAGGDDDSDDDEDDDDDQDGDKKGTKSVSGQGTGVGGLSGSRNVADLVLDTGFLRQIASEMTK